MGVYTTLVINLPCSKITLTSNNDILLFYSVSVVNNMYSKEQLSNQFCSWRANTALASEGPNGDSIATPSIYLYNILLNIKYNYLVAKDLKFTFFQTMNNIAVFKRIVSANFDGFLKRDVSKR